MNMKTRNSERLVMLIAALLSAGTVFGQSEDSLSKQLANPLAALISVPVQINYIDDLGVDWSARFQVTFLFPK